MELEFLWVKSSDFFGLPNGLLGQLLNFLVFELDFISLYFFRFERDKERRIAAHRRAVLRKESQIAEHSRKLRQIETRMVLETNKLKETVAELTNLRRVR